MKTLRTAALTRPAEDQDVGEAPLLVQGIVSVLPFDLVLVSATVWISAAVVLLDGPIALRVLLGIPFIFFFPGYAVVSFFFPNRQGVDGIERIALSFGLSIALIPLIALVLDRSDWAIAPTPIVVALSIVTTVVTGLAAVRRACHPPNQRYAVTVKLPTVPSVATWDRQTRVVLGLMALAVLFLLIGGAFAVVARVSGGRTTEFAMFNADGKAQYYERVAPVGQAVQVTLSITNHEGQTVTYEIRVGGEGDAVGPLSPVAVKDGETWTGPVEFAVHQAGDQLPVSFELWRVDRPTATTPYRTLRLMVEGVDAVR